LIQGWARFDSLAGVGDVWPSFGLVARRVGFNNRWAAVVRARRWRCLPGWTVVLVHADVGRGQ